MEYGKAAADRSKALIGFFLATCAFVGIFKAWGFGLWWFLVIPVGMITVSLVGGTIFAADHALRTRYPKMLTFAVPDIAQLGLSTVGSYYALKFTHSWMF